MRREEEKKKSFLGEMRKSVWKRERNNERLWKNKRDVKQKHSEQM